MSFHNVRLSEYMSIFAKGGPEFSTHSAHTASGREIRCAERDFARQRYFIENCKLNYRQFEEFNAFFRARGGQNYSFRFKDPADHKCLRQIIDQIDINQEKFRLYKLYNCEINAYKRYILKPTAGTIKVYIDNNQVYNSEINHDIGIVTLAAPLRHAQVLSAEFDFDVEVRFASDSFRYSYSVDGTIELETLELIEVL